jgi:DNA-binding CsgD family transcriptional regulator
VSGAHGALVRKRFSDWRLSRGEAEAAPFALKGCSIAEIAGLRGSSPRTVRSQLGQLYASAGVTGQPMVMSLFLDDLLDAPPHGTGIDAQTPTGTDFPAAGA